VEYAGEEPAMSEDIASLQRQLTEAETNLRLIRERKSEFVLIPI
jgi:hypothetical protein